MRKTVFLLVCISLLMVANAAQPPGKVSVNFNDEVLINQTSMTIQDQDFCYDVTTPVLKLNCQLNMVTSYETEVTIQQTAVSYQNCQTSDNIFVSAGGMANWQSLAELICNDFTWQWFSFDSPTQQMTNYPIKTEGIISKESELLSNLNILNCNLKYPLLA